MNPAPVNLSVLRPDLIPHSQAAWACSLEGKQRTNSLLASMHSCVYRGWPTEMAIMGGCNEVKVHHDRPMTLGFPFLSEVTTKV